MEQLDLAEKLYHRLEKPLGAVPGKLAVAEFLGRHERTKDALDICEPLWKDARELERVAVTCIGILFGSNNKPLTPDLVQLNRVAGWFEQATARPKALEAMVLQVQVERARKQIDRAVNLIHEFTDPPNTTPEILGTLADLAEKMEQFDLAEKLYRRLAALPGISVQGKLVSAAFLGRHEHTKDALDICEPLWKDTREIERVAVTCIGILFGSNNNPYAPDPMQLNRVAGWFAQATAEPKARTAMVLQVRIERARKGIDQAVKLIRAFTAPADTTPEILGTLADLAEKMEQFDLAEKLYRRLAALLGISVQGKLVSAAFLGRHEHTKDALDICEPLWKDARELERVAVTCIGILFGSDDKPHIPDPVQLHRVAGWFAQATARPPNARMDPGLAGPDRASPQANRPGRETDP